MKSGMCLSMLFYACHCLYHAGITSDALCLGYLSLAGWLAGQYVDVCTNHCLTRNHNNFTSYISYLSYLNGNDVCVIHYLQLSEAITMGGGDDFAR